MDSQLESNLLWDLTSIKITYTLLILLRNEFMK